MAVNSGPRLFNHDIPPAASPGGPLQSVGQDPLDSTLAVLDANTYMGPDDIQLTLVPGPVDDNLTWARLLDPSAHLDYSIDYVSVLLVFILYSLVMKYMSFPSSNLH